jgi:hypothetical protein
MAKPIAKKEDGEADDVFEVSVDNKRQQKVEVVVAVLLGERPDNGVSNSPRRVWRA